MPLAEVSMPANHGWGLATSQSGPQSGATWDDVDEAVAVEVKECRLPALFVWLEQGNLPLGGRLGA